MNISFKYGKQRPKDDRIMLRKTKIHQRGITQKLEDKGCVFCFRHTGYERCINVSNIKSRGK